MYTEEQLRQIFRALVNQNDNEINNMYYSDFSTRLGFSSPDERREEFYVTKEISRYVTTGPKLIHHFLGQTFLQKTADDESMKKFFEFKQEGKDWKDYLSSADLFKYFTFQNSVISKIYQTQQDQLETKPVEELFLTLLPMVPVKEFFTLQTKIDENLEEIEQLDLTNASFDDVQKAVLQELSDTYLSQVNGNEKVYHYSLDPNFYPEDFTHFPSIKDISTLNLNDYGGGILDARAGYIFDKSRFNMENKSAESCDGVVGSENFEGASSEMSEN